MGFQSFSKKMCTLKFIGLQYDKNNQGLNWKIIFIIIIIIIIIL